MATRHKRNIGFQTRLLAEMQRWGFTQSSLALRLKVTQGAVSGWFNRGYLPQPRILHSLAELLDVRAEWLVTGQDPKLSPEAERRGEQSVKSLPPAKLLSFGEKLPIYQKVPTLEVPLVSWAQAGFATSYDELPKDWQETYPAAVNDRKAFALQLRGDSMEPKFSDGDIAIVLPDTPPRNGDLVVANVRDQGCTFKIMHLIGGDLDKIRLSPYNTVYPTLDFSREQFHWIYPVHSVNKIVRR